MEYWRPHTDEDDEDEEGGRGGKSFVPQWRNLFQWLR
jgi:hypothetical protein